MMLVTYMVLYLSSPHVDVWIFRCTVRFQLQLANLKLKFTKIKKKSKTLYGLTHHFTKHAGDVIVLREENKACFAFHISCHFSGKVPITHDALCLRTLFGILACGEQIGYHQPFHSCISPFLCCSLNIKHSQPSVMG